MNGGFDLYGTYYKNANDALNAEIAQCAEIDNRNNSQRIKKLEHTLSEREPEPKNEIRELWEYINYLEGRIRILEEKK